MNNKKYIVSALACMFASAAMAVPSGYSLVWSDEFNGSSLDTSKWNYNYPWGSYHNHMANCRPEQVTVGNGLMTITAIAERSIWDPWGIQTDSFGWLNLDYTSGAINTSGKLNFTYGYVEGRFKMPWQSSTWPAFWMLQDSGWPPEIDIFEVPDARNKFYYNVHYSYNNAHRSVGGSYTGPDLSAGWHTYGMEWSPGNIRFYLDGNQIRSIDHWSLDGQCANMYLIINLAVGGWAASPNSADYPAKLQCDWVRVYSKQGGGTVADGTYKIIARHSGKAMDASGLGTSNGTQIHQWSYLGGSNQKWNVTGIGNGNYKIIGVQSGKSVDIDGIASSNGTKVQLWDYWNGTSQQFKFAATDSGYYRITPNCATGSCLDVAGISTADGAYVHLWQWGSAWNQQWSFQAP